MADMGAGSWPMTFMKLSYRFNRLEVHSHCGNGHERPHFQPCSAGDSPFVLKVQGGTFMEELIHYLTHTSPGAI